MGPDPKSSLDSSCSGSGLVVRFDAADEEREDTVWKSSYVNALPDSAFLYIEAGGTKDAEGKTAPRSLRHFPVKNDTGDVDIVHVRNAIGRIPQASIDAKLKAGLQAKAEKLLGASRTDEAALESRDEVVHFDAKRMKRTPQGGMKGPAALTRVGVFRYTRKDGTVVREYRPAEEVFDAESLASLDDAPVTDLHPSVMVDTTNFTALSKGHVREGRKDADGRHVVTENLVIQDASLAAKVQRGDRREISMGYTCRLDMTPGVFEGQAYDAIQRGLRYNHAALLAPGGGRQGHTVALRFDACQTQEVLPMVIRLDGKSYDLSKPEELTAYQAALDAKEKATKDGADAQQAKLDAANQELAPLKAERATAARAKLEASARKVLKDTAIKFDGSTDRQVMERAVGADKCTGKSDAYVAVRFDVAVERADEETPDPAAPPQDPALMAALAAIAPAFKGSIVTPQLAPGQTPISELWMKPLTFHKST